MTNSNPSGRPTKLTPALIKQVRSYIDDCTQFEDVVPTIAGLSIALGVARSTVHDWANPKSDRYSASFSDMLDELMAKQEKELVANGLQSVWNPAITKLMMAKHNYTDKIDHTSDGQKIEGNTLIVKRYDGEPGS